MRLIDADRYKEELESLIEICDFEGENDVKEGIQSAIHTLDSENFTPTVDAEPIIRCKDCKYWAEFTFNVPPFNYCGRLFQDGNTESIGFYMEADDFCSRGERK